MNTASQRKLLQIRIAGLELILNARGTGNNLELLSPHDEFLKHQVGNPENFPVVEGNLQLNIIDSAIPPGIRLADPIFVSKIFEVEEQPSGVLVFYAPRQKPPRAIRIDPQFSTGEIYGDFSSLLSHPFYPLQYIDIIIFSNWLAKYGEVILHASGIALDGKGYCFVGKSGTGKSTLIGLLGDKQGLTILGEDQVILRQINGQFWIFGTPWHVNPAHCSPMGVPLKKIFLLTKNGSESITPLAPAEGMKRLIQSAFIPFYRRNLISGILEKLSRLSEQIPYHELSYLLDSDILNLINR